MAATVEISSGFLCGIEVDGVLSFRGIPYAAPPIGALRFRAPQPVQPWPAVRDAQVYGSAAAQLPNKLAQLGDTSEDCLYLNVWTQGPVGQKPVMVFVHGGGYVFGAGHEPTYNGHALAKRGDVVIVTINYRLSALGFLYLAELLAGHDCAANPGLLDVLCALRWVRAEIAAFGGDPNKVTVFGESAGGGLVSALCALPAARGLFARAISQSGGLRVMPAAPAAAIARELFAILQVDPKRPERLWELPVDAILNATTHLTSPGLWGVRSQDASAARPSFRFGTVGDGELVPDDLVAAVSSTANPAPLLIGSNLHEWRFFSRLVPELAWGDATAIRAQLITAFGADATLLLEVYARAPQLLGTAPEDIADAIVGDAVFRMPSICLAEAALPHAPVFMYRLDHRCPRRRGELGACHVVDLPLVFRTLDSPTGHYFVGDSLEAQALCDVVSDAWLAFARHGDPRTSALPDWPRYDSTQRATQILSTACHVERDPLGEQRRAWQDLGKFTTQPPPGSAG